MFCFARKTKNSNVDSFLQEPDISRGLLFKIITTLHEILDLSKISGGLFFYLSQKNLRFSDEKANFPFRNTLI